MSKPLNTILLTDAQRDDLLDMLNTLKAIVDKNSTDKYTELFATRLTKRRIETIIQAVRGNLTAPPL